MVLVHGVLGLREEPVLNTVMKLLSTFGAKGLTVTSPADEPVEKTAREFAGALPSQLSRPAINAGRFSVVSPEN
jgi:hypothetical protein